MAIATVVLAFLMGGVVIAATQHGGPWTRIHNTFVAYNQILDGAGLNWFGHFFRHPCLGFIPCHLASTSTAGAAPLTKQRTTLLPDESVAALNVAISL